MALITRIVPVDNLRPLYAPPAIHLEQMSPPAWLLNTAGDLP